METHLEEDSMDDHSYGPDGGEKDTRRKSDALRISHPTVRTPDSPRMHSRVNRIRRGKKLQALGRMSLKEAEWEKNAKRVKTELEMTSVKLPEFKQP